MCEASFARCSKWLKLSSKQGELAVIQYRTTKIKDKCYLIHIKKERCGILLRSKLTIFTQSRECFAMEVPTLYAAWSLGTGKKPEVNLAQRANQRLPSKNSCRKCNQQISLAGKAE